MKTPRPFVVLTMLTMALTAGARLSAEDASSLAPIDDASSSGERNREGKAKLAADLADYGRQNGDAFALLAAASLLNGLDGTVAKRGNSGKLGDHQSEAYYSADKVLDDVETLAGDSGERESLLTLVNGLREDSASPLKKPRNLDKSGEPLEYVHTHYRWDCDIFGNCRYIYITHSHP